MNSSLNVTPRFLAKHLWLAAVLGLLGSGPVGWAQTLPMVGVHDSELTRALATMPAHGRTPITPGMTSWGFSYGVTGFEWWTPEWNYFFMPDSVKEMLNSDGTMHAVVSDADIAAGGLLVNGKPKYPILISLASEAINDNEIAPLTNYVAAGGFLFVGSSAFTRNPDGTYRNDFAIAPQMGVTMYLPGEPVSWWTNNHINKLSYAMPDHRLTADIPWGTMNWAMPQTDDDTPWGVSPDHDRYHPYEYYLFDHTTSTLLLGTDEANLLTVQQYGKGYIIYFGMFQPLVGNGGWAPTTYAYSIFRNAIEWAFESNELPIPKLSPWPFAYDAAFTCRHDLENYQSSISHIEASAGIEFTNGVKGDYYFCTGTLRVELTNSPAVIAGLRRAVTNYGATIGSHNGGLPNPDNSALVLSDYDYWHWGPDEVLDYTPAGYPDGKTYAFASLSNSFVDIETWLSGINTGGRKWVGCYFNSTREDSYDILEKLQVKTAGDQKLSPFPHWTLSTRTADKKYSFLSIGPSEFYQGDNNLQCLDSFGGDNGALYDTNTLHYAVDYYYDLGALINIYSHTLATGEGYAGLDTGAGGLMPEYINYSLNTNLHPRLWVANAQMIYDWWSKRSTAQVSASYTNSGLYQIATAQIAGATSADTAIELKFMTTNDLSGASVYTNGVLAGASTYRIKGQIIKVLVGTIVSQVQVSLLTSGDTYFIETFDRANDPAPAEPFTSYSGTWTISAGKMLGGPNYSASYGYAFYTNGTSGWTDYAVEAQLTVPIGGFGGGVGGRLNPATGAHYAAWLYPESTPGGAAQLRLIKFDTWTQFSYGGNPSAPMVEVPLPNGLGTNSHAVRLAFRGNQIAVFYDNARMISMTDTGTPTYTSGGITLEMYTDTTPYTMAVDQVKVTALVVADQYTVGVNKTLTVPAPGVLANDCPMVGTPGATLAGNVQHGTLGLNADGSFTYTPFTNYTGSDSFIYQAGDGDGVMASATATITIAPLHNGPSLPVQTNLVVNELVPLVVTNTAIDTDIPLPPLTYTLVAGSPTNATISTNGIISWTPAQTQAPGTNTITTVVTDGSLSATNSFTVVVNEVNIAPTLPVQPTFTVGRLKTLVVTNTATEIDIHVISLTYTLLGPTNAAISTNGIITWTPTMDQDGTTNLFTTIVTNFDPLAVNAQHLSATNTFTVIVSSTETIVMAGNTLLTEGCAPTNHVIDPGETVTVLFSLQNTGFGDTANLVASLLQTNGVVYPSAPQSYSVVVAGGAPVVEPFTFSATGACGGTITATLRLQDGALNLGTISTTFPLGGNGTIFTQNFDTVTAPALPVGWTTTNTASLSAWVTSTKSNNTAPNAIYVSDPATAGTNALFSPPITLPLGQSQLTFRNNYSLEAASGEGYCDGGVLQIKIGNNAFTDIVAAGGSFVSGGYNATISSAYGSPIAGRQAWSSNSVGFVSTVVNLPASAAGQTIQLEWLCGTDTGNYPGSPTNGWYIDSIGITGAACCANNAPVLPNQPNRTIGELTTMVVTNTVVDTGIPASALTYTLLTAPTNATISTNGVITWTPTQTQSPSTNVFTTVATHSGAPSVSSTNSFTVTVLEVNVAPALPVIPAQTINELTLLTVTNIATNSNIHSTIAGYTLVNPPAGATIDASGIIRWTPSQNQSPSTNTITTVVTNSNPYDLVNPRLTATNNFTVVVREVNVAPTLLPGIPAQTINELTLLTVTNTASNANIHSTIAGYALVNPPAGVAINANGIITWTPTEAQGPCTNTITTVVTNSNPYDLANPRLTATNSFTVVVNEINTPPVLPNQPNVTTSGTATVTVTNTATDSDIPVNTLNYSLFAAPANAVINSAGVITWTPLPSQVPSTNVFTTIVTDYNPKAVNAQQLSATNTFFVFVTPVHSGPVLPSQNDVAVNELSLLVVTNTASDADLPPKKLTYSLIEAPSGTSIDTNGVITWTPTEAQGPSTNVITTVVVDNGSPPLATANTFTVVVNELNVAPVLPLPTNRTISGLDTLVVTNTATDADIPANSLSYWLAAAPTNATVDGSGVITWHPAAAQVPGTYTFVTVVTDSSPEAVNAQHLSATNTFAVQVTAVHNGPWLSAQSDRAVNELTTITVTNSANDVDLPALGLVYSLINPPSGLVIDTNGVITWTPTEAQGPSTNLITTVVTDTGTPPLSATNQFSIVVNEVNTPPTLPAQVQRSINEMTVLVVTNTASDADLPPNVISYLLIDAPTGASIDTNGVITWTPSEAQGPGTYTITTVATDNGIPSLSVTNSFGVVVFEVNRPPVLPEQAPQTVPELTQLVVTNTATDPDLPANGLNYELVDPPAGAAISTNGIITWTPSETQGPSTVMLTTVVRDDGSPSLSATNTITVNVLEVNTSPWLPQQTTSTINEQTLLVVTNTASDADYPPNHLSYVLLNPPPGASIDTNGIITWTPTEAQGPTNVIITTLVVDDGDPVLGAVNSFTVIVREVNTAPVLPPQGDRTLIATQPLTVTNTASDSDIPVNPLSYVLSQAPVGATIDAQGIITWTPAIWQVPSTNAFTTIVTDTNATAVNAQRLSATNTFTVFVNATHSGPTLPAQTNISVLELTALAVTNTASSTDIPALAFSYQLINPPTGASIDTSGVITWTPTEAQGPSTALITTVVTDAGLPPKRATNSFVVTVTEVNSAPTLPGQNDRQNLGLTPMIVTNTASDSDIPANTLNYSLVNPPTGAAISSKGVITWVPKADQVGQNLVFTTVVTDYNPSALTNQFLSATNSFTVNIAPVHNGPVLPTQPNYAVSAGSVLTVTNTAADYDVPATHLTYILLPPYIANCSIDANGIITFAPSGLQGNTTNRISTYVYDDSSMSLGAQNSFYVTVHEVNVAPTLPVIPTQTVNELTFLTVTNTATNANIHSTIMGYGLVNPPAGATIGANGVITWTPSQNQSPSTNTITAVVTNTNPYDPVSPQLTATNSFVVVVREANVAPTLPEIPTQTVNELTLLTVTNTASNANIHSTILGYGLVNPPAGAAIGANGVITWTPSQNQSPSTTTITTVVTNSNPYDLVNPLLTATKSFTVIVREVNVAPTLPVIPAQTVNELTLLTVTNTASNANIHSTILGYGLVNPPSGAAIDASGIITWTPSQNRSQNTNTITTVVTNSNPYDLVSPELTATNSFTVVVLDVNTAPELAPIADRTVAELATLTVPTVATDHDVPANVLSYHLEGAPQGAAIGNQGVFSWTPTEAQGPSTNRITVVVTDDGIPALSATNSFTVVVTEVNSAPVLGSIADQTVAELTTLMVTNAATDADIPANVLSYHLEGAPQGATIDNQGVFSWTPSEAQGPSTNRITVVVTDDGIPALSATNSFTVVVTEVNSAPVLGSIADQTVAELTTLTVTNTATDADIPANVLSYHLEGAPQGARIDNHGVFSWTPSEAQGPSTNRITVVVTDDGSPALSATNSFTVVVTEVNSAPSLPPVADQTVQELTTLTVTNTATDGDIPANVLSYRLEGAPEGAAIDANGVLSWTPTEAQGPSTNRITVVVTDDGSPALSATNSFTVVVTEVNSAPVLGSIADQTVAELTTLTVTNTATDADIPANVLSYHLEGAPQGATIDNQGVFSWTPTEAQGPSTNRITVVVTDDGIPALSATNSFTVVVTEVNSAPVLGSIADQTVAELTTLTVTNTATDADIPANVLSYHLEGAPQGARIDNHGVFSWTPSEAQGPSTNRITVVVTDDGSPALSATNSFTVVVTEVNSAPSLPPVADQTVQELTTLTVTNTATDGDIPANVLSYRLEGAPEGAAIDANGVLSWTPTEAQGPSTNRITVVVTDDGSPALSATNSFTVVVTEVNSAPVLGSIADQTVAELTTLTVTNTATDADIPANVLSYHLEGAPQGATIDNQGVFSWTPTEAQGPSTNRITVVVTDDGIPALSATNSFIVVVIEVNSAPVPPSVPDQTVAELTTLMVTNTATDSDIPANVLSYRLEGAPEGAAIDAQGIFTWTPTEAQGPSTNVITVVVTDDGSPVLSATNTFTVVVTEVNSAPVPPTVPDQTVAELTTLTVTNTATDNDLPANVLTYRLDQAPEGMVIDAEGIITWTPTEAQGPSTNRITVVVTDDGIPALSATNSFTVVVLDVNTAPKLAPIADQTVAELTTLTVPTVATDSDIPANVLSYRLEGAPTGAAINAAGVITWTPTEAQGPSTNLITVVVTDDGSPVLSGTNSFTVVVTEVNSAPVLPPVDDQTVAELTMLTVTNTATDSDIPANVLSYRLEGAPEGAAIDAQGIFTWTPTEAQGPSTNVITVVVTDDGSPALSATNHFTVVVTDVNSAPVLGSIADQTIAELTTLTVTNTATDRDVPANVLSYHLEGAPEGAAIDAHGVIAWTPTEAQGPSTNVITVVVTDDGSPVLSATNSFIVVVIEVNSAPVPPSVPDQTVAELTTLTVTNTATDSDIPANVLSYRLEGAPEGAAIDAQGIFTWTPTEAQGPSTNVITVVVTDDGSPVLSATNSFTVVVTEVNSAPVLPPVDDQTVAELTMLTVTNTATDSDIPANVLSYRLEGAPEGAAIDAQGIFTWTPTEAQCPSTNRITVVVTDDGIPALSATNSFTVVVLDVNTAPKLAPIADQTVAELTTLTVPTVATDSDIPANVLSYRLEGAPTGAAINAAGVITWTPTEAQGPSTNLITVVVTDDGSPVLSGTNSFTVVVTEVNSAPVLPPVDDQTVAELTMLTVTNTATDSDIPANVLSYRLEGAPEGAAIDAQGIFTWTPTEAQCPSTNRITVVVTDDGIPALSATNSFTVVVLDVNTAPKLAPIADQTVAELTTLTVPTVATDSDIPANVLSYRLEGAPTGAAINAAGVITWTPTEAQGPSTNLITVVVTDDGHPALSATNSFTVVVAKATVVAPSSLSIAQYKESFILQWSSVPGQHYQLQYKTALVDAEWTNLGSEIVATQHITQATDDPGGAPLRLYRVVPLSQP